MNANETYVAELEQRRAAWDAEATQMIEDAVEAIARAIHDHEFDDDPSLAWETEEFDAAELYRDLARLAVEAIGLAPTTAMVTVTGEDGHRSLRQNPHHLFRLTNLEAAE